MSSVWIVHRDERRRAAIARLAGVAPEECLVDAPGSARFDAAPAPGLVLLGLGGDLEAELEFAHRALARLPGARWILLVEPADRSEALRLFDSLRAEHLVFPPPLDHLRARIRAALGRRSVERLSDRSQRDAVAARFSRFFADLELPDLLRALDPRLGGVPLLIRGERGTGRALLAQYVHAFGGSLGSSLVFVPCAVAHHEEDILAPIRVSAEASADPDSLTICLEDAHGLPLALQHELLRWIEFAPPGGVVRASRLRWMATVGDDREGALHPGLSPELAQALAGISLRIPSLRERAPDIERLALETTRAWCAARGLPPVELAADALEALQEYPWPGNRRELEAVVVRSLAAGGQGHLRSHGLRFDPAPRPGAEAPAPPAARALGEAPRAEPAAPSQAEPEAPVSAPEEPAREAPAAREPELLRRLSSAMAHEIRNPLVAIRTFAQLLPERFEDPEFRERFRESVEADVGRIEAVLERLSEFAGFEPAPAEPVDVTELIERLLEQRRGATLERGLVVLKELERNEPHALGQPAALEFVFEALLERALAWLPEGADLYVASRHHAAGPRGEPLLRVLLSFPAGADAALTDVALEDVSLELLLAERVLREEGGRLTIDRTDPVRSLMVVDLPAPA